VVSKREVSVAEAGEAEVVDTKKVALTAEAMAAAASTENIDIYSGYTAYKILSLDGGRIFFIGSKKDGSLFSAH
jgi:hypothetical protein